MSVVIPTSTARISHPRSNLQAALTALLAIVSRDLLVMRREVIVLLMQTLMQPLFMLFVIGKVFSTIGASSSGFSTLLVPGIAALTVLVTALQGPSVDLARDLSFTREIDDRLLAPLPTLLVAAEKLGLSTLRSLISGVLVFPLAALVLGSAFQIRSDRLGLAIALILLVALVGAALGLLLAVVAPIQLLPVIFALVFTPLIFTGCTLYSWASLAPIRWFQIVTLFNPLTYAAEGLRYALIPSVHGHALPTLALGWVVLVLGGTFIACFIASMWLFYRRVIS
jgi:ABC-2 type transport system permease protein